jgi:acetyl esterase/lipase
MISVMPNTGLAIELQPAERAQKSKPVLLHMHGGGFEE